MRGWWYYSLHQIEDEFVSWIIIMLIIVVCFWCSLVDRFWLCERDQRVQIAADSMLHTLLCRYVSSCLADLYLCIYIYTYLLLQGNLIHHRQYHQFCVPFFMLARVRINLIIKLYSLSRWNDSCFWQVSSIKPFVQYPENFCDAKVAWRAISNWQAGCTKMLWKIGFKSGERVNQQFFCVGRIL